VHRLFSMFPTGREGIALLILRISLATMLIVNGFPHLEPISPRWGFACLVILAVPLCLGLLTPVLSGVCCLISLATLWTGSGSAPLYLILLILNATALAILGPGAYSLDARMFGRRRLIFPRDFE
jgi:uncharacterized membrane protein YphA (DoxX/SURF4 family)